MTLIGDWVYVINNATDDEQNNNRQAGLVLNVKADTVTCNIGVFGDQSNYNMEVLYGVTQSAGTGGRYYVVTRVS